MRVIICITAIIGGPLYLISQAQAGTLDMGQVLTFGALFLLGCGGLYTAYKKAAGVPR